MFFQALENTCANSFFEDTRRLKCSGFNCRLYYLGPYLKVANKPVIISAPENLNLVAVYTREVALLVSAQH